MGRTLLRISIQESDTALGFTLEGRLAGPWVDELTRAWRETAPRVDGKQMWIDLRNVTYSDAGGKQALREMFEHTRAELLTSSPWSQYLADEVRNGKLREGLEG